MPTSKICKICLQNKKLSEYASLPHTKDGKDGRCKVCVAVNTRRYTQTLKGLCCDIYNNELSSSKHRGHPLPEYSQTELYDWMISKGLVSLHKTWEDSGYQKGLRPSVDRVDSNKPYTFSNIRLVTWTVNNSAAYIERKSCKLVTKQCRAVAQYLDGVLVNTYKSIASAARATGIQRTNINAVCTHKATRAGGYTWEHL